MRSDHVTTPMYAGIPINQIETSDRFPMEAQSTSNGQQQLGMDNSRRLPRARLVFDSGTMQTSIQPASIQPTQLQEITAVPDAVSYESCNDAAPVLIVTSNDTGITHAAAARRVDAMRRHLL